MDDIFDQIDMLERGAQPVSPPCEPTYNGVDQAWNEFDTTFPQEYDAPPRETFDAAPMQLDSFDQRLMRQPDHDSTLAQVAPGHARLSLPPGNLQGFGTQSAPTAQDSRPPFSQQDRLLQFTYEPAAQNLSSTSAQQSPHFSSPTFEASRRHGAVQATRNTSYEHVPRTQRTLAAASLSLPSLQRYQDDSHISGDSPVRTLVQQGVHSNPTPSQDPFPRYKTGPPIAQGIQLVAVRELPDRLRPVFPFVLFNAVQSKCFPVLFRTNDNFVVSAPTGSGKTAILELAICRLISSFGDGNFKIVYQGPTKALCSERQRDWQSKFGPLGLQCAELTGDTDNAQLRKVQHASIIVTTPEKWDSITRKWKDHQKLMHMVKLFLIDEVHILGEDRGATLEVVVSRMKSIGSDVRFVALSATVPNAQDISTWLGKDASHPQIPAPRERFGEEFRPVMLQRHICGYHGPDNDFAFEKVLNSKLTGVIGKWSQRKPLMVFCMTRKACVETAKLLASWWAQKGPRERYWEAPRSRLAAKDVDLRETIKSGVAFHHAGLETEERIAIETAYLNGDINVICCTSTLAVGVNLPCHMVIIKGTVSWARSGIKEYSDLEVMQMLGRAGRPQFDDSAIAVIMTRLQRVSFYEKMVSGQEVLESCLHQNLTEHLNAEIGLCTINDVFSAKKWLSGTLLFVRLKENPDYYKIDSDVPGHNLDERLEKICIRGLTALQEHDLIRGAAKFQCTEFGDAMARYYVCFDTMKHFLQLPPKAKTSEILSALCMAAEFKEVRFRVGERPIYRTMNNNGGLKFPIPGNIELAAHKVSLIIQSTLGSIDLPTEEPKHRNEYQTHKAVVFQHAHRLIKCIVDCSLYLEDSVSARNALTLARSLGAKVWDDSPLHMGQLDQLGPASVRKLVAAGIRSIEELESCEPERIERALSRNPPFGTQIQKRAIAFPRLRITMKMIGEPKMVKDKCVSVKVKAEIGFINDTVPETFGGKVIHVCLLADTSDGRKVHFARISAKKLNRGKEVLFTADLRTAGLSIRGSLMCDEIAGTQQTATIHPELPAFMFPAQNVTNSSAGPPRTTVNAPKIAKRRAEHGTTHQDEDEFGDAGINDEDLAAAEHEDFANINDFDDEGNNQKKSQAKAASMDNYTESPKLPNGKWSCHHRCKDKTSCKHPCCREGLDKKPKPPKPKASKKESDGSPLAAPKQTQLSLVKTKPTSTAPADTEPFKSNNTIRAHEKAKETRDLYRLHDSVKTSVAPIPRINNQASPKRNTSRTQPPWKPIHGEHDFDIVDSDDFPTDSTFMNSFVANKEDPEAPANALDDSQGMLFDDNDFGTTQLDDFAPGDLIDLSSYTDKFEADATPWAPAPDDEEKCRNTALADKFLERTPVPHRKADSKGIFITGDSTDSFDVVVDEADNATASLTSASHHNVKRPLEQASEAYAPPSKKYKIATEHEFQPLDTSMHGNDDLFAESTEFDQASNLMQQVTMPVMPRDPDLEWFESTFGTEDFDIIDR